MFKIPSIGCKRPILLCTALKSLAVPFPACQSLVRRAGRYVCVFCLVQNKICSFSLNHENLNILLIEKYTPDWINKFVDLKREIDKGLNGSEYQIEHVGSTSVPDLDSKPVIDIDIVYENESEFEKIKSGLIKLGYFHNGNQGIEQREVFKRNGKKFNKILDAIKHHLYVCPSHSYELEKHILFRDFLRNNEWARIEYESKKYELAKKANQDKKKYAELKELHLNDFINSIVEHEKRTHTIL